MGAREEILKRIERKQAEVRDLEALIRDANTYVQTMQEALRLLPKDQADGSPAPIKLRQNSTVAKVHEILLKAGRPLHISDILKALGKPVDKKTRSSLSGTIGAYVREGKVFTRPEPNTFGLIQAKDEESREGEEREGEEEEDELPLKHATLNGVNRD